MEEFIEKMVAKVGIDKATAEKVFGDHHYHAGEAVKLLEKSALKDLLLRLVKRIRRLIHSR